MPATLSTPPSWHLPFYLPASSHLVFFTSHGSLSSSLLRVCPPSPPLMSFIFLLGALQASLPLLHVQETPCLLKGPWRAECQRASLVSAAQELVKRLRVCLNVLSLPGVHYFIIPLETYSPYILVHLFPSCVSITGARDGRQG